MPTVPAAASSGEIVLSNASHTGVYVAKPAAQSLLLLRNTGAVMAAQSLDGVPTALALDPRRGLLYVALQGSGGIDVLNAASLRRVLTLHAVAAARLTAVPGHAALYLMAAATGHTLYLSYDRHGAVHISDLTVRAQHRAAVRRRTAAMRRAHAARMQPLANDLHVAVHVLSAKRPRRMSWMATFWASGFAPGESVAVSWGAHNQGTVTADRYGLVGGSLPVVTGAGATAHSVGLYGLSSHRYLAQTVAAPSVQTGRARKKAQPPLYLGILPGSVATFQAPLLHKPIRVPMSAAALPVAPLLLLIGLLLRRKRRKKRRQAAQRRPAGRPARRAAARAR